MNWKDDCFQEILKIAPSLQRFSQVEWYIPNTGMVIYIRDIALSAIEIQTVKTAKYMTIWEDYWFHAAPKIISILSSSLGLNKTIFARKTQIFKIDAQQASDFLNTYHLLNACKAKTHLGLSYENQLVALASFSKPKKFEYQGKPILSYEMIRFVCKSGITVVGGLSKLVQYFIDAHRPCHLMTYIDAELSSGVNLQKIGLSFDMQKPALEFAVALKPMKRILKKDIEKNPLDEYVMIQNQGNLKFSAYFT